MKKIMKKVLSLALVVALAIAPMTVMAADDPALTTDGSTQILNLLDGTVWRDFDPTDDGTLTITIEDVSGSAALTVTDYSNYSNPIRSQLATGDTYSFDYSAGKAYEFAFECIDYSASACAVAYCVTLGNGETGGDDSGPENTAGSTELDPIVLELVNGSTSVQVNQNNKVYYAVPVQAGTEYTLIVSPGMKGGLNLHVGLDAPLYGYNQSVETTFTPNGYSYVFAIEGLGMNPNFTIELKEAEPENIIGTMNNKDALVLDQFKEISFSGQPYYCTWTATEDGTLSIEMPDMFNSSGWTYGINDEDYDIMGYGSSADGSTTPVEFSVAANDVITVWFATESLEEGGFADGFSVFYKATFTAGATGGDQGGDGGDQGGDGGDQGGDDVNYEMGAALEGGTKEYATSLYEYTIYTFDPTETGKYTISSTDSVLGIVSYNGMWVTIDPSAETVKDSSLVWECVDVGQSIWVAARPATNVANITVTRDELDVSDEIPWTIYENTVTPNDFTFTGDADKLQYVDVEDTTIDKAVLGEDGYYHLNTEDGPILFVDLDDEMMSLSAMNNNGKLSYIVYEDDEVVSKTQYNEAFAAYYACADKETGLYPLTDDLMAMYKNIGVTHEWYSGNGIVTLGTEEDAWMFACYYDEAITSLAPSTGGSTTGGTTASGSATAQPSSPKTGDNASIAVWAIAMVVAAGAAYVVAETKKRAR